MTFFRTDTWLREHGQRVDALVTSVTEKSVQGYGIKMSSTLSQNFYIVTAVWIDSQTQTDFTFEKRCFNSAPHTKEGQTLTVYIDPENPKHYCMLLEC